MDFVLIPTHATITYSFILQLLFSIPAEEDSYCTALSVLLFVFVILPINLPVHLQVIKPSLAAV